MRDDRCFIYHELTGMSLSLNTGQCCELYNGTISLVFEEHMIGDVMEIGKKKADQIISQTIYSI